MKHWLLLLAFGWLLSSCGTSAPISEDSGGFGPRQSTEADGSPTLTQSLFNDKSATISEESIQKILDGSLKLPAQLRVTVTRLQHPDSRRHRWSMFSDEWYLKTQQAYLDSFSQQFRRAPRVTKVSVLPELLIAQAPTFTNIREAAVRMQSDLIVVYSITSDIYTKYKFFNRPDIKAFATTELIVLDVRTGLIPFSTIVTRDVLAQRTKDETGNEEARRRIQHEAVLLTVKEIGDQLAVFLARK